MTVQVYLALVCTSCDEPLVQWDGAESDLTEPVRFNAMDMPEGTWECPNCDDAHEFVFSVEVA